MTDLPPTDIPAAAVPPADGAQPSWRAPTLRVLNAGAAAERELLEAFLDFYRDVLVHKVRGVSDADAAVGELEDSWAVTDADTLGGAIADYEFSCAVSRQAAASFALDDTLDHPDAGRVSLRWIYVHMIEETARHTGQLG